MFAALLLIGCTDVDLFGVTYRQIAGEYELHQVEGSYFLERDGAGSFKAMYVEELGWTDEYIFAKKDSTSRRKIGG